LEEKIEIAEECISFLIRQHEKEGNASTHKEERKKTGSALRQSFGWTAKVSFFSYFFSSFFRL
jgi:hypothetical protein